MPMKSVEVTTWSADGTKSTKTVELDLPNDAPVTDFWCECAEDHGSDFHDDEYDEEGRRTSKHHYTCRSCGKVTQVG